jgi:hypothetical protein
MEKGNEPNGSWPFMKKTSDRYTESVVKHPNGKVVLKALDNAANVSVLGRKV